MRLLPDPLILFTLALVPALLNPTGFAWADDADADAAEAEDAAPIDPVGEPKGDLDAAAGLFRVWYDEDGWHIRTRAERGFRIPFRGIVRVSDGRFGSLKTNGLEGAKDPNADYWEVNRERTTLRFTRNTLTPRAGGRQPPEVRARRTKSKQPPPAASRSRLSNAAARLLCDPARNR